MPPRPHILLKDGYFWTGNRLAPHARFIVCTGDRISSVSVDEPPTDAIELKIDLKGRFAMPGFIDSHTHFRIGGASLYRLDLHAARSESEFSEAVRNRAKTHPDGRWMLGGGWDHENWQSRKLPAKELIDGFTTSFPVFLDRVDTHMALLNSRALELAGITKETPDPAGGVIVRNDRGEPTGIVKDAAREMVMKVIPEPPLEELMRDAREAMRLANRLGVTTVTDISPQRDLNAYLELEKRGEMTVRVNLVLPISEYHTLVDLGIQADDPVQSSEWIRPGAVKAFADGSLGAGTAWFSDPYEDDHTNSGLATAILSSGELEELATDADRHHIQLAVHAIGDRAVGSVLDIYEVIRRQNPSWDRRLRIEHAQHLRENDFSRFKELDVIASAQPYHCIDDGRWAETKIGSRRSKTAFAFRRFLDERVTLAFGTDWPVAPLDPLQGIYAAVTRATTDGMNPGGWVPEQKISLEESLIAYTYGSAYASFSENNKGTLEAGKLADIVVLSRNPFEVRPEELKNIKIIMTVAGGKVVYADEMIFGSEHHGIVAS